MKSLTVWRGHSTRPSLTAGTERKGKENLLHGRRSRLIMPPAKKSRAFPTGNALLYISLLSVALIASFTSRAILNDLFAICNSRLLPTNQIVNCEAGCVLFRAHPVFVSSWLGVCQNAFTGSFSPWLHRGWFCAVPPSGRTIPPLQGRREQRKHWFWYPVRRSFPCPQRTA